MRTHSKSGFSLLEVAIALTIMALLLASMGVVSKSTYDAYGSASVRTQLDTDVRSAVNFIAAELISVDAMTPDPQMPFGTETLDFQQAVDVVAGNVVLGDLVQLSVQYEAGEIDDGVDNNQNGLVDECVLVFTRDLGGPNQMRIALVHNVREWMEGETFNGLDDNGNTLRDERGFNLVREGNVMTIRLTLEALGSKNELVTSSFETSVSVRN